MNFPFICSNIPAAAAYGVYISQLIRYYDCDHGVPYIKLYPCYNYIYIEHWSWEKSEHLVHNQDSEGENASLLREQTVTSSVTEATNPSEAHVFTPALSRIRGVRYLVVCVVICRSS